MHLLTDGSGNPQEVLLSQGQEHDINAGFELIKEVPRGVKHFVADMGYDSDLFRVAIKSKKIEPVIPGRKLRKVKIKYDEEVYSERYHVENTFCRLKQYRSISTRFDKYANNFLAMVQLGCIMLWLKL